MRHQNRFVSLWIGSVAIAVALVSGGCTKDSDAKPKFVYKEAPRAGVVAKINGKDVTEEELIGDAKVSFFDLKKREYELKMERLNALLVERLVGAEAKAKGMSTADFIKKHVTEGKLKVSKKEFDDFVKEKRIPESQVNDRLKDRINNYLEEGKKDEIVKAYIAKLTKKNPVEVYFKRPRMDIKIELGKAPTWGNDNAKVTVVEFSDFQCPFCSKADATLQQVKKKYKGKIKVAFKHFPLPMHREAKPAHEASNCIAEQSSDKFWNFHDSLFANQSKLDTASLESYAKKAGADMKKFNDCVASKRHVKTVQADLDQGDKLGVRSTPTFFVNGQLLSGAVPLDQFSQLIEEELEFAE